MHAVIGRKARVVRANGLVARWCSTFFRFSPAFASSDLSHSLFVLFLPLSGPRPSAGPPLLPVTPAKLSTSLRLPCLSDFFSIQP